MKMSLMRALMALSLTALALVPASAGAQEPPPGFEASLQSGGVNIQVSPECDLRRGALTCVLYGIEAGPKAKCGFGGAVPSVRVTPRGNARRAHVCVDEAFHDWPVLASGQAWRSGAFRCLHVASRPVPGSPGRLRCLNAVDRGFSITGHGRVRHVWAVPRQVVATRRDGIREIAGLEIGPLAAGGPVPTLADARRSLGRPSRVRRAFEACTARWNGGLQMVFTTFGLRGPCSSRPLQTATLRSRGWSVRIGAETYRIGSPASRIPKRARHYADWGGGGYMLASMRFVGGRTPTVLAHVSRGRIDRFFVFVGGAGD